MTKIADKILIKLKKMQRYNVFFEDIRSRNYKNDLLINFKIIKIEFY